MQEVTGSSPVLPIYDSTATTSKSQDVAEKQTQQVLVLDRSVTFSSAVVLLADKQTSS